MEIDEDKERTIVTHKGNALGGPGRTAAKETGIDTHLDGLCVGGCGVVEDEKQRAGLWMGSLSVSGGKQKQRKVNKQRNGPGRRF